LPVKKAQGKTKGKEEWGTVEKREREREHRGAWGRRYLYPKNGGPCTQLLAVTIALLAVGIYVGWIQG
jgi:hypothetical protein